jgi:hypothetical protein
MWQGRQQNIYEKRWDCPTAFFNVGDLFYHVGDLFYPLG